ncbi:pyridine nucleotide-disulfide oxidoreductase [Hyphomonas polymorpha PS728]|uniref:Thioredoxin reductase n=1 Tax=Hyphomonas polymorpha PS728 TaxID=1280954 RepID=A0A062VDC9_9PROT|nr:NAD(P)/FAD-dependent oxidoreductase [Hyphomonas polymorpha]KCZ98314.1 pyridine nucleotide-disulfide oxidoreductase [Hyphomonas polymorpha PS728]
MGHDVIVIGGSYAGMAAALQLLRARRKVLIIDAGQRRNRAAEASHGFLGQDGADPALIASKARSQLEAYPTLQWLDDLALEAARNEEDASFTVRSWNGARHQGARLILATGVSDTLPEINGLTERWGQHVFHCPYCHGYELDQGAIGVIATGPMSLHQAELLTEWGEVTLLVNGAMALDEAARAKLAARRVRIEEVPILGIEGGADVRLADGRRLRFAGLFTAPRNAPATPIAQQLGCELEATVSGTQIRRNEMHETSVPGVFACGDAAHIPHSVSIAVGDGALTGIMAHRSLVF